MICETDDGVPYEIKARLRWLDDTHTNLEVFVSFNINNQDYVRVYIIHREQLEFLNYDTVLTNTFKDLYKEITDKVVELEHERIWKK